MSKRSQTRERVASRRKQERQRLVVSGVIAALFVGVVIVIMASSNAAPAVSTERLNLDAVQGSPNAKVTLTEYGAYACPACRQWHQAGVVEQILAQYPEQVRFVFRDYPVISPAYDQMAAEIAQCALDQGQDQFWMLHNALYTTITAGSSAETILSTAGQLGLNESALRACSDAHTHRLTVQFDLGRGRDLGLPGTPSFLVNEQRVFDLSPDTLNAAIQQALNT